MFPEPADFYDRCEADYMPLGGWRKQANPRRLHLSAVLEFDAAMLDRFDSLQAVIEYWHGIIEEVAAPDWI